MNLSDPYLQALVTIAIGQAALVAVVAWAISSRSLARRPAISGAVCAQGMLIILALTATVPMPIHKLVRLVQFETATTETMTFPRTAESDFRAGELVTQPNLFAAMPWFSLVELVGRSNVATHAEDRVPDQTRWFWLFGISMFIALVSTWGMIQFIAGMVAIRRIVRLAKPIEDAGLMQRLQRTSDAMGVQRKVGVFESPEVGCGAVCGWRQPRLLLPKVWRDWSPDQLDAVLAHELAHVKRNDFAWRMVACLATSLHYFNPLVHLTNRKLQLAQELSADRLACHVLGRERYLKSLAQLMLDAQSCRARIEHAGVAPVFSGYLIRRIKMLKSDGKRSSQANTGQSGKFGFLLLLATGLVALATRGLVQPPVVADEPVQRIAKLGSMDDPRSQVVEGTFARKKLDLSQFPESSNGFFNVELSEAIGKLGLEQNNVIDFLNLLASQGLKQTLDCDHSPSVDLRRIESIRGEVAVTMDLNIEDIEEGDGVENSEGEAEEENRNSISIGASGTQVVFRDPVDLKAWTETIATSVESKREAGEEVYTVPTKGTFSDGNVALGQGDQRSIWLSPGAKAHDKGSNADNVLTKLNHTAKPNQSNWASAFERIDGGLIAAVVTNAQVRSQVDSEAFEDLDAWNDEAKLALIGVRLMKSFETIGFGLDISEQNELVVQLQFNSQDKADAIQMLSDLQAYHSKLLTEMKAEETKSDVMTQLAVEVVNNARTTLTKNSDKSWSAAVVSTAKLPESLTAALGQLMLSASN